MTDITKTWPEIPRLMLTPEEAAATLGISRTRIYALMAAGRVESVLVGRSRRVPLAALEEFVARLRDDTATPRR